MLFDRSQGLFAGIVSVSHFRWQRRFCVFELKYLEHCEVLSSRFPISPRSSINRASKRGRDGIGLPNNAFVEFAPVFDQILWRFAFSWSQANDFKVARAATRNIDRMRLTVCPTLNLWVRAVIAMLRWLGSVIRLSPVSPKSNLTSQGLRP